MFCSRLWYESTSTAQGTKKLSPVNIQQILTRKILIYPTSLPKSIETGWSPKSQHGVERPQGLACLSPASFSKPTAALHPCRPTPLHALPSRPLLTWLGIPYFFKSPLRQHLLLEASGAPPFQKPRSDQGLPFRLPLSAVLVPHSTHRTVSSFIYSLGLSNMILTIIVSVPIKKPGT